MQCAQQSWENTFKTSENFHNHIWFGDLGLQIHVSVKISIVTSSPREACKFTQTAVHAATTPLKTWKHHQSHRQSHQTASFPDLLERLGESHDTCKLISNKNWSKTTKKQTITIAIVRFCAWEFWPVSLSHWELCQLWQLILRSNVENFIPYD